VELDSIYFVFTWAAESADVSKKDVLQFAQALELVFYPQSRPDEVSSAPRETTRAFLYPLSQHEKVAVTGLSPAVYRAVIKIKAENSFDEVDIVSVNTSSKLDIGALLMKLDIADLERLVEALELTLQADKAAATDVAIAEKLYHEALQINPYDAVAAMSRGVALAKQGNLREGLKWIQAAHDLAPDNERIAQNLAAIKSYL
jgi:Flp pilus assembly protein TadD